MVGAECVAVVQDESTALHYESTALHIAAPNNFLEVAELLLGAGASVDIKNKVRAGCS